MVDILYKSGENVKDPNKEKTKQEFLSYYMHKRLQKFLDNNIKARISKYDKDYVMIIDGYEGSGKSTFAQQIGKYVDPSLNLSRICMTVDEFRNSIDKAEKGQCVIYDEAVTGLTASDSISRIGKILKAMMMQMRQKNLFVIVIIPVIFELSKYAALSRARSFFHVYEKNIKEGNPHRWVGFNKKATRLMYLKGKKTHSYLQRSRFSGVFYGKYVVNEQEYRAKKQEALMLVEDDTRAKVKDQKFAKLCSEYYKNKVPGFESHVKAANTLNSMGIKISPRGFGYLCEQIANIDTVVA
jgi:adenylate kinase family enzyme